MGAILRCYPHKILGLLSLAVYLVISCVVFPRYNNYTFMLLLCVNFLLFYLGAQLPSMLVISMSRILGVLLLFNTLGIYLNDSSSSWNSLISVLTFFKLCITLYNVYMFPTTLGVLLLLCSLLRYKYPSNRCI